MAVHVPETLRQRFECRRIEAAVRRNAGPCAFDQLIARPSGSRDADNGKIQLASTGKGLQGRKDLLERQISSRTKEHECVGSGPRDVHERSGCGAYRTEPAVSVTAPKERRVTSLMTDRQRRANNAQR